jgi:hypothetical protein
MATTRPFAYNPQFSPANLITGTLQIGDLAIGVDALDYGSNPGGVTWFMGPNEDNGYVIAAPVPSGDFPTQIPDGFSPDGGAMVGTVQFWGTDNTEAGFIAMAQMVTDQTFATGADAVTYLNANGYWTSFV